MKATKMRNKQIYRASLRTRSDQLGSALSKELRGKYKKRSVRVVRGDTVKVVRGEYKDVDGKVAHVSAVTSCIAIEGIKKEKGKGDKFDVMIHASNVVVTGLNTDDSWRMAKLENKSPKSIPKQPKKTDTKAAPEPKTDTAAPDKKEPAPEPKKPSTVKNKPAETKEIKAQDSESRKKEDDV